MACRNIILSAVSALILSAFWPAGPAQAQDPTRPLLMEGKDTLFKRILVRDRTAQHSDPDGTAGATVLPLQPLYVYEEQGDWIRVAANDSGKNLFWIKADKTTPWRQNIVATVQTSSNVDRLLFFSDIDSIYDVVESEDPGIVADDLRKEAEEAAQGGTPSETVVALGPREAVDQRQNLYVMPILEAEEAIFESGSFVNLLKVAVARADPKGAINIDTPVGASDITRENYRAGVVFVVDTTISMEPYIRRTQAALTESYKRVKSNGVDEAVSFGLIGYRDNLNAAPGLEYDVRTFVDLQEGFNPQSFLDGIGQMTEAKTSSKNYREDSFAGIEHALQSLDWSGFGARFIVLVTDASPRNADDELSTTGLNAQGLNQVVRERIGGAVAVVHLRTQRGKKDHARAEDAYRELTRQPNLPPLYFPVENGDRATYEETAREIGQIVADQVKDFREGSEPRDFDDGDSGGTSAFRSAGRTMQLAYLGRSTGAQAPDVFEAVVADRDFNRPGLKPLSIRLLLTKAELSNLDEALRLIIEQAEESIIDPTEFFSQVLGAAADMSRRPDKVSRRSDPNLAEAVNIAEFIEDLPYKSRIMSISEEDWVRMSISEQQSIVNDLYEKIERYRRYNSATDQWVDYLGTGAAADSLVYPMNLDDLP